MKLKRWIALLLIAVLALSLLSGCQKNTDEDTDQPPSDQPTDSPPSDQPTDLPTGSPTDSPNDVTANPSFTPPPSPQPVAPLKFPDLDGLEKTETEDGAIYASTGVTIWLSIKPANETQLAEAETEWGPALQAYLSGIMPAPITNSQEIEASGLGCKGLELEIALSDLNYCMGLVIPLQEHSQLVAAYCIAMLEIDGSKQALLDARDELLQKLTL